jgi:hypothetical protein
MTHTKAGSALFINDNIKLESSILGEIAFLRSIEPQTYKSIRKYVRKLQEKKKLFQKNERKD